MKIFELTAIAVGLSLDAFAVALCKGLAMPGKVNKKSAVIIGLYFGGFQALMPLIGYYFGSKFLVYIEKFDHWIAFALLCIIGINMLREGIADLKNDSIGDDINCKVDVNTMVPAAIATSIDALAVGITLSVLNVNIFLSSGFIGIVTFVLSIVGVFVGHIFGSKYKAKAEILGGIILILIGCKIIAEHLFIA